MDNNEKIFDELFCEYYQSIFKYCVSIVLDVHVADEITNEAYARLWNIWDERVSYPKRLNRGWLVRAVEYIIKETDRKEAANDINEIAKLMENDNDVSSKNEQMQYEYYISKVRGYLKPRDQELFDLWVTEELTYPEIAERLKIKEVSVRSRISRMRKRIDPHVRKIIEENLK